MHLDPKRFFPFFLLLLASCSDYSLTINDNLVYDPPRIFTNFSLSDLDLQRCADQTIKEMAITTAAAVTSLLCPEKGIHTLNGVSIFSELKIFGLENNQLSDIKPLANLKKLEQLNLAGNELEDISALQGLTQLQYLNLQQNPKLNCQQLAKIRLSKGGEILRPDHCKT